MRSHGIHLRALSLDDVKIPINKTRLKIAVLKWHPGPPGANELNILKPQQNGWLYVDYILKSIFLNENACILIKYVNEIQSDMPLLRVNMEISVFYTPSLCCLRTLNYLRILLISLKKYLFAQNQFKINFQEGLVSIYGPFSGLQAL